MKRAILIMSLFLCCSPVFALLMQLEGYPYHFQQRTWPNGPENPPQDAPFFLISKTAFRALNTGNPEIADIPESRITNSELDNFIEEAHEMGFNSLRIWMLWWYKHNEQAYLVSCPWSEYPPTPTPIGWEPEPDFTPSLPSNWWQHFPNQFQSEYWDRLRYILSKLDSFDMEAQITLFDWGALECFGRTEAKNFLAYPNPKTGQPTPSDNRLTLYLDKVTEFLTTCGHTNWRIEIGNQMDDCWDRSTPGPLAPANVEFEEWIRQTGEYINSRIGSIGNLTSNSSPSTDSFSPGSHDRLYSAAFYWNSPILFAGVDDTDNWFRKDYDLIKNGRQLMATSTPVPNGYQNLTPLPVQKPVLVNETRKYVSPTPDPSNGAAYTQKERARWELYLSAMAGGYMTYHSQGAVLMDSQAEDDGDDFIPTFKSIMTSVDWFELWPDFEDDSVIINWGNEFWPYPLKNDNVFPLVGFEESIIYFLTENATASSQDHRLQLNAAIFPDAKYEFKWYNPENGTATPIPTQTKWMTQGDRFLELPETICHNRLENSDVSLRDAVVVIKRLNDPTPTPNATPALISQINLNQTRFSPGDQFTLNFTVENTTGNDLLAESYFGLYIENIGVWLWRWTTSEDWTNAIWFAESKYQQLNTLTKYVFDFEWPPCDLGNLEPFFFLYVVEPNTNRGCIYSGDITSFTAQKIGGSTQHRFVNNIIGRDDGQARGSMDDPWLTLEYAFGRITDEFEGTGKVCLLQLTPGNHWFDNDLTVPDRTIIQGSSKSDSIILSSAISEFPFWEPLVFLYDDSAIEQCIIKAPLMTYNCSPWITDNKFICMEHFSAQNSSITIKGGHPKIINNLFYSEAPDPGAPTSMTSGIRLFCSSPKIKDCTFDNLRTGIYCGYYDFEVQGNSVCDSGPVIQNSILSGCTFAALDMTSYLPGSSLKLPLFESCTFNTNNGTNVMWPEGCAGQAFSGITFENPLFVDAANHDYYLRQGIDGLPDSPCVDNGLPKEHMFDIPQGVTNAKGLPDRCERDRGYHYRASLKSAKWGHLDGKGYNNPMLNAIHNGNPDMVAIDIKGILRVFLTSSDGCHMIELEQNLPGGIKAIDLADIDGDGLDDIISASANGIRIYKYDQITARLVTLQAFSSSSEISQIKAEDLDGSGKSSVTVVTDTGIPVLKNDGNGELIADSTVPVENAEKIEFKDADGDGKPDMLTAKEDGSIKLWSNNGAAQFNDTTQPFDSLEVEDFIMEDLDADGCPDIVVTTVLGETKSYRNDCAGNFTELLPTPTPSPTPEGPEATPTPY